MARKRMISPEFFTSRTLNELPVQSMVTFSGLWCYVDDSGRGEDDVVMVKAAIWPRRRSMPAKKVEADLAALDRAFLICRYQVAGFDLLHVVNWREHQKISHPAKSKLPPCRFHEAAEWSLFTTDADPSLEKFRRGSGEPPDGFGSDSTAIEVKSIEENLSDPGSCAHGFPEDSPDCLMCRRRNGRSA